MKKYLIASALLMIVVFLALGYQTGGTTGVLGVLEGLSTILLVVGCLILLGLIIWGWEVVQKKLHAEEISKNTFFALLQKIYKFCTKHKMFFQTWFWCSVGLVIVSGVLNVLQTGIPVGANGYKPSFVEGALDSVIRDVRHDPSVLIGLLILSFIITTVFNFLSVQGLWGRVCLLVGVLILVMFGWYFGGFLGAILVVITLLLFGIMIKVNDLLNKK